MRVLITGGSGQIGTALRESARPGDTTAAPPSAELDISDRNQVDAAFAEIRPDLVINAAAYTAVDMAELEPERAFSVNALGAENVARACAMRAVPLFHLSTDYVFDGLKRSPYSEDDLATPLNAYGRSKLEGEHRLLDVLPDALILRVGWVFSPTGTNFVKTMLQLANRAEVRVVDDQWGHPTAAADIADCVWRLAAIDPAETIGTFHFSSLPTTTRSRFAEKIFAVARRIGLTNFVPSVVPIPSSEYPTRARRPAYSALDSRRLASRFGIHPSPWTDALERVLSAMQH